MPYVQFTTRHFIDDHLYEAGERAWLGDHVALSAGMIDLGAEAKAAAAPGEATLQPAPTVSGGAA